jgi:hypothetical protein
MINHSFDKVNAPKFAHYRSGSQIVQPQLNDHIRHGSQSVSHPNQQVVSYSEIPH